MKVMIHDINNFSTKRSITGLDAKTFN